MKYTHAALGLSFWFSACDGADDPSDTDMPIDEISSPAVAPAQAQEIEAGQSASYTITGLDDGQAYRVTLVVDGNLQPGAGGTGQFVDNDANGAADAGLSEEIALITAVNGEAMTGTKTVPGGEDDPAMPSGVFPMGGQITIDVTGVASGTVYPVAYVNGGASTFLELDSGGTPTEPYGIGGALTVTGGALGPSVSPMAAQTVSAGDMTTYTVSGLDDAGAYRITLVVAENLTMGASGATFLDEDANGAADAGASEAIALLVAVNGEEVTGTKTVPSGEDNPAAPSGVHPVGGQITVDVMGVAPGMVYPVAYVNGGASTFLELDAEGSPVESYAVGGLLTVQ